MATFTIPQAKINSSGELLMSRSGADVAAKCPFRKDDGGNVAALLVCDHNCPHFIEAFNAKGSTIQVTQTCGGGNPQPSWMITNDLRTATGGETISTLTFPLSKSVPCGVGLNATKFAGFKFTTNQAADISKVTWFISSVSTTSISMKCQIFSDSGGKPNSQTGGDSGSVTLYKHHHENASFTWSSSVPSLSANTAYWALLVDNSSDGVFSIGATYENPLRLASDEMDSGTGTGSSYSASSFATASGYEFLASVLTASSSSKAISTFDEESTGVQTWGNGVSGCQNLGMAFVATSSASGTVERVRVRMAYVSEAMTLKARLYSNSAGSPGTQTGGDSDTVELASTSNEQIVKFSWSSSAPSASSGSTYWVVLMDTSTGGHGQIRVASDNPLGISGMKSGKHDTITSIVDQSDYEFIAEIKFA